MQVSKYWFNFIRTLLPMVSNPLGNPKTLSSPSIDTTSSILVRGGISGLLPPVFFWSFLRQMHSFVPRFMSSHFFFNSSNVRTVNDMAFTTFSHASFFFPFDTTLLNFQQRIIFFPSP